MKLTVANRIFGGFGVISLLLIFIASLSFSKLQSISETTSAVNTVSIPALENSATLQSEFVKMSKISLQAFYADEVKTVASLENAFAIERDAYDAAAKNLQAVVAKEPELAANFKKVENTYNEFTPTSNNLFTKLKESLTLRDKIASKLSDLEGNADDSASLILDFSDTRDVSRRFPKSAEAAAVLETSMNSLVSTVVDLSRTNAANTSETLSNEIKNRMADISSKMEVINQEAGESVSMVADLNEKIVAINDLLNGSDGILPLKAQRITASADAATLLATAESQTTEASAALTEVTDQGAHRSWPYSN